MRRLAAIAGVAAAASLLPACARHARSAPDGAYVVCESPSAVPAAGDVEARHPAGSRVVLVERGGARRELSTGLFGAGEPAVMPDGERVVFSAKARAKADKAGEKGPRELWEASLDGGAPRRLTDVPEGASSPAMLPDGTAVFVSKGRLFTVSAKGDAVRPLTFGVAPVSDPFVLADGRVLFVSRQPDGSREALFAVNDDGTGVTAYAANHDGAPFLARPREEGARVIFASWSAPSKVATESVLESRPWISRAPYEDPAPAVSASPGWNLVEAVPLAPRRVAKRRLSTVNPEKKTGILLCLDVNRSDLPGGRAARVRVTTPSGPLGEVVPAADGSLLAEVPADVPLGLVALDENGNAIRTLAPSIWVRPGETRGCIGCHERHGLAPRNHRPAAVKVAAAKLGAYDGGAR